MSGKNCASFTVKYDDYVSSSKWQEIKDDDLVQLYSDDSVMREMSQTNMKAIITPPNLLSVQVILQIIFFW